MAIVVDTGLGQSPPPSDTESDDGRLTAHVFSDGAGVLLTYVPDQDEDVPVTVSFRRRSGEQPVVRGGNPAPAPGGYAAAFDNEAPLGVPVGYLATPIDGNGADGDVSSVTVTIPLPDAPRDAWLKDPARPGRSMRVLMTERPELEYAARRELTEIKGKPRPIPSRDVRAAPEGEFECLTKSLDETAALRTLTGTGVVLFQTSTRYGYEDMYLSLGDVTVSSEEPPDEASRGVRLWTMPFTQVDPPSPTTAPLRIPGRSYDSEVSLIDEYADLVDSYDTYRALGWG